MAGGEIFFGNIRLKTGQAAVAGPCATDILL